MRLRWRVGPSYTLGNLLGTSKACLRPLGAFGFVLPTYFPPCPFYFAGVVDIVDVADVAVIGVVAAALGVSPGGAPRPRPRPGRRPVVVAVAVSPRPPHTSETGPVRTTPSADALVPTARGRITRRTTTAPEAATDLLVVLVPLPGDPPRPPRAASAYTLLLAYAWPGSPVATN